MNTLNKLSIKTRLFILSLIPLLALFYYLQINLRREWSLKQSARRELVNVDEIDNLSGVLTELQKERAYALGYISSQSPSLKAQLQSQFESTDKAISTFENAYKIPLTAKYKYWDYFDSLQVIRSHIADRNEMETINNFYLNLKTLLLDRVSLISSSSKSLDIKNMFNSNILLIETKDFLSAIRSRLGKVILTGKFENKDYAVFSGYRDEYKDYMHKFLTECSPGLRKYFEDKYKGPLVNRTQAIIDSVYYHPDLSGVKYDFNTWWETASNSINILENTEDYSRSLIVKKATENLSTANSILILNISLALAVVIFIILFTVATIKGIVNAIYGLKNAADRMAKGEVNVTLDVNSRDELGALANSFSEMISVTREFSNIADVIGKGEYDKEVRIRGKGDTLGIALNNMKDNLRKLSEENERRTWLLTGSGELNDTMRGEKGINDLVQEALSKLAEFMKAQIGAIYLRNNGQLDMIGSYAFQFRKGNTNSFKIGEGLVGQAALEKKPILFGEVPEDYIHINSGLGNSAPKNIIIYPLLYEGEVNGVIELGSNKEFNEMHMRFLEIVSENIAIAINSAQSRTQLRELLEETQRQAEELEAQQEELRQTNEELEEKTELLEKSEAELRAQQEELQQSNEELEEKANILEEQKQKLEDAKIELEYKAREIEVTSKYKSEFLANMSHELRTPLNSILILAQLLSENKSKNLKEKEIEYANNVYNSGIDLLNLINEILDLSKVEAGKIELDIGDTSFLDLKEDISAMFGELAKSKSIDFTIKIDKALESHSINTDRQRLEQILRNILSNAFKFTEKKGKVSIVISRFNDFNENYGGKLKPSDQVISFAVNDTGIGIPDTKQSIIFEAFQQADGSTKRKFGGTGLGLSISRQIAEALGGEILLQSKEGEGSTFTLLLPGKFDQDRKSELGTRLKISARKPGQASDKKKPVMEIMQELPDETTVSDDRYIISENEKIILIIEDDAEFAALLLEFVRERNYKGVVATQGNTGLSLARHFKPDAILLDMNLPVMDGSEVLTHLKNDPALRHIPVQVISGYDKRKEGLDLGAFDFIMKPVTKQLLDSVFDRIEDFINRKLKRLLIVEDDEIQNKAIRNLIGNGDVKCFSAYSGNEAYDILCKENYDSIIVDLGLPDMTGFELLEKIKSDKRLNKIPVIVYTGKDLTREERNHLNRLASTVVLKTADSKERLLDETTLFLHRVESNLPREKQNIIRRLHKTDEVLQNKTILIVDDDIRNIYSLTNALEEEGLHCISAENGKEAVDLLKSSNSGIHMVLMDIMMPEMDGYEATREIRKNPRLSKIPIIALTAKAMKGDREKCLNAGMSDYISKPVNIEQLLSLLRVWLYK